MTTAAENPLREVSTIAAKALISEALCHSPVTQRMRTPDGVSTAEAAQHCPPDTVLPASLRPALHSHNLTAAPPALQPCSTRRRLLSRHQRAHSPTSATSSCEGAQRVHPSQPSPPACIARRRLHLRLSPTQATPGPPSRGGVPRLPMRPLGAHFTILCPTQRLYLVTARYHGQEPLLHPVVSQDL